MVQARQRNNRTGFAISGLLAVVITILLLVPTSGTSAPKIIGFDKIIHFVLFFLLVVPALSYAPRTWVWVVPVAILYGAMIEIIQPYFGRGREFGDFVANSLGALVAVPVSRWVHTRWLEPRQISDDKRPEGNR